MSVKYVAQVGACLCISCTGYVWVWLMCGFGFRWPSGITAALELSISGLQPVWLQRTNRLENIFLLFLLLSVHPAPHSTPPSEPPPKHLCWSNSLKINQINHRCILNHVNCRVLLCIYCWGKVEWCWVAFLWRRASRQARRSPWASSRQITSRGFLVCTTIINAHLIQMRGRNKITQGPGFSVQCLQQGYLSYRLVLYIWSLDFSPKHQFTVSQTVHGSVYPVKRWPLACSYVILRMKIFMWGNIQFGDC